ncbi:MAG: PRD domain-containing protein [Enterococcaceae bacterium]|jgi:transcriptional antiterminator|nr:PRD domain-containing protein [Enterococcaceae bacterium]MCI1919764.1 PRD domain-containing protein [Enterococcaceae bacterium]
MNRQKDREDKLKLLLSKQRNFMTSEKLAELMKTSTKTVYRLVKKINEDYEGDHLIISEKGRGYKLDYEKFIQQSMSAAASDIETTPAKRQETVMEELLLSSPKSLKISELFKKHFIGDSAIANDEKVISEKIRVYDLQLVRKNRTLAILGKEEDVRRAIADLIQRMNFIDIEEIKASEGLNFNRYDVLFVTDQLALIEQELNGNIPYPYNVNIFSHVYILITRTRQSSQRFLPQAISNSQREVLDEDPKIKSIATEIISNVEKYLGKRLPEIEVVYLYQYMVSSRMDNEAGKIQAFSSSVIAVTEYYLVEMGKRLDLVIKSDSIFNDLANHIKPMLNRLENRIRVKNGLLEQIQITYEKIYQDVTEVSKEVSEKFHLEKINPDEAGFITLYFARVIETHQLPIQTVIMCTTGVGTSELLRTKVSKKFPELKIVSVVASRDYRRILAEHPGLELILTTIALNEQVSINTLLVSAMLTADDQARIQEKIEEIYHGR